MDTSIFMSLWYYFSAIENLSCLCMSDFSCSVCDSRTVPPFSIPSVSCLLPAAVSTHCGRCDLMEQGPGMARF